jgi:hypothetical protein
MSDKIRENKQPILQFTSIISPLPNSTNDLPIHNRLRNLKKKLGPDLDFLHRNIDLVGRGGELIEKHLTLMEEAINHEAVKSLYSVSEERMARFPTFHNTSHPQGKSSHVSTLVKGDKKTGMPANSSKPLPPEAKTSLSRHQRLEKLNEAIAYILINLHKNAISASRHESSIEKCLVEMESMAKKLTTFTAYVQARYQRLEAPIPIEKKLDYANDLVNLNFIKVKILKMLADAFKQQAEYPAAVVQSAKNLLLKPTMQQWVIQQAAVDTPALRYLLDLIRIDDCPVLEETTQLLRGLVTRSHEATYNALLQILQKKCEPPEAREAASVALRASNSTYRKQLLPVLQQLLQEKHDNIGCCVAMEILSDFARRGEEAAIQLTTQQLTHRLSTVRQVAAKVLTEAQIPTPSSLSSSQTTASSSSSSLLPSLGDQQLLASDARFFPPIAAQPLKESKESEESVVETKESTLPYLPPGAACVIQ